MTHQDQQSSARLKLASAVPAIVQWVIVGVCSALPLGWMAYQLVSHPSAAGWGNWGHFQWQLLARTLFYNGAAACLAVVMALPAAMVIGRGRDFLAELLTILIPLGVLMPSVAYTYGWVQVFRLARMNFAPAGAADIARCVWTLACWLWPLAAITIGLSLRFLDSQVQQQALLDGALWRITLRQLIGPIAASFALVAVLAMQEFAVYEKTGISVIATEVRTVFETGAYGSASNPIAAVVSASGAAGPNQAQRAAVAVATALPMLVIVTVLVLFAMVLLRKVSASGNVEAGNWPAVLNAGKVSKLLTMGILLLTLVTPIGAMILSISPLRWHAIGGHSMPVRIWLVHGSSVWGSLLVAILAGCVGAVLAVVSMVRPSRVILAIGLAGFLVGGELLGVAGIRLYNRQAPWPLGLASVYDRDSFSVIYNSSAIVILAHVGRFAWLASLAGLAAHSPALRELREAAAMDGAGRWRTTFHVILPLLWPLTAAAAVLVVILSLTEVGATVLIAPPQADLLVPRLMTWVHMLRYDDMLEASLLLMVVVMFLGLGLISLINLAARAIALRRANAMAALLLSIILLAGCGKSDKPEAIWLETGVGPGQVVYPRAITYSKKDDCFFICDRMAHIQRVERDGNVSADWRMEEWTNGKPVGLTVGPDGNLYVPHTHYGRVVVFSPKGKKLREWGSFGRADGQFIYPTDIAFDAGGNIYVSEYGDNDRIQVFDPVSLKVIRKIGRFGAANGEFARPQSILIEDDLLYVTDSCNHRLAIFKTDGTFVRNLGGVGSGLGEFKFPYGLDMDSSGNLVVAEFGNNRIQFIDKQTGRGLRTWGHAGRAEGELAYPWAVAVGKNGKVVVVDSGNNRLQVLK